MIFKFPIGSADLGEIPQPSDEEFLGRNHPQDAGTEDMGRGDYSPDDHFGSSSFESEVF